MTNSKKLHRTCRYYNKPNPRTITDNSELLYCKRCKAIPKNLIETVDYVESKWYEFSKHFELTTWMSCEICWEPLIEKEKWNMRHEGTRHPNTGKGPRIGNTPLPPVRKNDEELNMLKGKAQRMDDKELSLVNMNMTDKEKVEMLFNYIEVIKANKSVYLDNRALRIATLRALTEIEKILMPKDDRLDWERLLREQERSK